ncbi:aspartate aminotransferase [Bifidobacterium vansinderenii]|uniref:Aspartate aminotransferase n=2 Tax=Bifidobacterium vansinderenii TaxID=1984871 RepID=A0A229W0E3_9BIFI|nr:aspartate aminotransferase [Bifidobacterium vansinderenii]
MEAIYLALIATLDIGDDILIPDPGYANYFGQVRMVHANVVPVPLSAANGFRMRAADVEAAITPRTKVLLLNSPSNPTGAIIDPDELAAIAEVAVSHDLWVISDEVYRAFVYDDDVRCLSIASMPGMKERTIVVDSFSKTFAVRLLHEGKVVVTPALGFGSRGRGFVRMSYVGTAQATAEGLRRMRAWLESL